MTTANVFVDWVRSGYFHVIMLNITLLDKQIHIVFVGLVIFGYVDVNKSNIT